MTSCKGCFRESLVGLAALAVLFMAAWVLSQIGVL